MKKRARKSLFVCTGFLPLACQGAPDAFDAQQQQENETAVESPLSGNSNFPADHQCTIPTQMFRLAGIVGRAREVLEDPAMLLCLTQHGISGDNGIMRERILARMLENKTTDIRCRSLDDNIGAKGSIDISGESVTFNTKHLNDATSDNQLLGYLLHEVAHNKGFNHPNIQTRSDNAEYEYTVPEQLAFCGMAIDAGDFVADYGLGPVPDGKGPAHGELARAAQLAHVGGDGGSDFLSRCPNNKFARGISGAAGARIDRIALVCGTREGTEADTRAEYGGTGGTSFLAVCPTGSLVAGLVGYADSIVNMLQPLCKTIAEVRNGGGGWLSFWNGSRTGDYFERICPKGMAVRRVNGRAGALVDNMVIECENLDNGTHQAIEWLPALGTASGTNFVEQCPAGTVMTQLTGSSDNNVARLGGICHEVNRFGTGAGDTPHVRMKISGAQEPVLEAHGSYAGSGWTTTCGNTSEALVGVGVNLDGTNIQRIWGACAHAENWSDERLAKPSTHSTRAYGRDRGSIVVRECPREYFLAGLETYVDSSRVRQVEAICVRAEQ